MLLCKSQANIRNIRLNWGSIFDLNTHWGMDDRRLISHLFWCHKWPENWAADAHIIKIKGVHSKSVCWLQHGGGVWLNEVFNLHVNPLWSNGTIWCRKTLQPLFNWMTEHMFNVYPLPKQILQHIYIYTCIAWSHEGKYNHSQYYSTEPPVKCILWISSPNCPVFIHKNSCKCVDQIYERTPRMVYNLAWIPAVLVCCLCTAMSCPEIDGWVASFTDRSRLRETSCWVCVYYSFPL